MHSTVVKQIKFHWLLVHFLHCRCLSGHQHSTLEGLRVKHPLCTIIVGAVILMHYIFINVHEALLSF